MDWIAVSAMEIALAVLAGWLAVLLLRGRRMRQRFALLGKVATVSDGAVSLDDTFDAICAILVPSFADICAIDVIDGETPPRRVALRVADGAPAGVEEGLRQRQPSVPRRMLEGQGRGALMPRFFQRLSDADLRAFAADDADFAFLKGIGVRSTITVGLRARGQVIGALTVSVGWSGRRYRDEDARFARILAGRVALALDNSGLFANLERAEASRAQIAQTLQQGLLPPPLPHIPDWSLAALYRPAGAENEVGGDFYDAFRVTDGWIVVVGDVTGRGARAASVTALARYTLRTAAMLSDDPRVALATLNRALLSRRDSSLCSVVAIALGDDPARPVRLAVAGHPPPLVVDGEAISEVSGASPVLGAFPEVEWRIQELRVDAGQQLVVITDGITEAEGGVGRFGEERLRAHLAGAANPTNAVQRIEGALHEFTAGSLDDDAAIVSLARSGDTAVARSTAAAIPTEAGRARVWSLYRAFNQRDPGQIVALCSPEMEFFAVTGGEVGRSEPYRGPAGLRQYLSDVERVWEELLITPSHVDQRGDLLLVVGRVYVRSRALGIRDMPVAWLWRLSDGVFVRGEVFGDPALATARFGDLETV